MTRNFFYKAFFYALLTVSIFSQTANKLTAEQWKKDLQYLREEIPAKVDSIFDNLSNSSSPGFQVSILIDGKKIYSKGFGLANLDYGEKISSNTIFQSASVSKQFTAFCILLLAKQGKLDLDDDIRTYLDWMPDFGMKITIRNLLNHTSGIRDQWELLSLSGVRQEDVILQEDIKKVLSRQKELNFIPGNQFMYSNSGYTLLAEIIQKVSGKNIADFTKQNIFDPLEMNNSHIHNDYEEVVKNRASSYYKENSGRWKYFILSYGSYGATDLFTTADDLCKWINNFFTGAVGGKDIINQMYERGILNNGDTIAYAMGLFTGKYNGYNLIQHDGWDAGFRTQVAWLPELGIGISILGNGSDLNPYTVYKKIFDMIVHENKNTVKTPGKEYVRIAPDSNAIKKLTGKYYFENNLAEIITDSGKVKGIFDGDMPLELIPIGENRYWLNEEGLEITFGEDSANTRILAYYSGKRKIVYREIEPYILNQDNIKEYLGHYYSKELETIFNIVSNDNKLIVSRNRNEDTVLKMIARDECYSDAMGLMKLYFYRDGEGIIKGFRASGSRALNINFEKFQP